MSDAEVGAKVADVLGRVDAAARAAGRDPKDVAVLAATKGVAPNEIVAAVDAGISLLGENRAQGLLANASEVLRLRPAADLSWHFIGRLQRNKVRLIAPFTDMWESVDREELGAVIARNAPEARVLIEVNVSLDPAKGGCTPEATPGLAEALRLHGLRVEGLMTIPAFGVDPRPAFASLRELAERLDLQELSMGMSSDFEQAISEGATIVRIGQAIFESTR